MVDKITSLYRDKVREKIGSIIVEQQSQLDQAIKFWLNLSG